MDSTIRALEDKIQSSRTTYGIYCKEIADLERQLEEKGIDINDIEGSIDEIMDRIDHLQRHQKMLYATAHKKIKAIEKRK